MSNEYYKLLKNINNTFTHKTDGYKCFLKANTEWYEFGDAIKKVKEKNYNNLGYTFMSFPLFMLCIYSNKYLTDTKNTKRCNNIKLLIKLFILIAICSYCYLFTWNIEIMIIISFMLLMAVGLTWLCVYLF